MLSASTGPSTTSVPNSMTVRSRGPSVSTARVGRIARRRFELGAGRVVVDPLQVPSLAQPRGIAAQHRA